MSSSLFTQSKTSQFSKTKTDFINWYSLNLNHDYLKWIHFSPLNVYHRYTATGHYVQLSWIRTWMAEIHSTISIDVPHDARIKKIKAMAMITNFTLPHTQQTDYTVLSEVIPHQRTGSSHQDLFKKWFMTHPELLTMSYIGYEKNVSDLYTLETSYIVDEVQIRKWIADLKMESEHE